MTTIAANTTLATKPAVQTNLTRRFRLSTFDLLGIGTFVIVTASVVSCFVLAM